MALTIIHPITPTVFACNPIVFTCSTSIGDGISIINVDIWNADHTVVLINAKYSVNNLACVFDLSGYIKNLFTSFDSIDYTSLIPVLDTCIKLQVDIYEDGGDPSTTILNIVYGVTQILEDDIDVYAGCVGKKFLTGFTTPKFWKGFPFSLSVVRDINPLTSVFVLYDSVSDEIDSNIGTSSDISVRNINISEIYNSDLTNHLWRSTPTIKAVLVESLTGEDWESEEKVVQLMDSTKIIGTPVYLRWLNQLGGYDYYMFYLKDIVESTKSLSINKYPSNLQAHHNQHDGTTKVISKVNIEHWTIGANWLTIAEFNELRKICRSPKVDLWMPDKSAFLGVVIADKTYTVPQDDEIIDIELDLIMPEIFTQR